MCAPTKYIGRRGNRTWYPRALSQPRYQRAILAYIYTLVVTPARPCRDPADALAVPARYTLHFTAPGRVPSGIPTGTGRAPVTFSENEDKSPLIAGRAPAGTRQDSGKTPVMPWSQFTKGAFSGSSRAVFGLFLVRPRPGAVHFFHLARAPGYF